MSEQETTVQPIQPCAVAIGGTFDISIPGLDARGNYSRLSFTLPWDASRDEFDKAVDFLFSIARIRALIWGIVKENLDEPRD
jgi:hypothetical protein